MQGRLTAASLATLALRQGKSPLRGLFALFRLPFGSGPSLRPGRPSPPPASLRADPVSRQRLIDFQPEQGHCCNALIFSCTGFAVKKTNRRNGQVWADPAENCRRVSVRPEEPAWMRVQGAFCRDATSCPPRLPGGISGGYCEATIFLPGAGIVKGAAIAPLTRSRVMKRQRNAGRKVNGIILRDTMFSLQNNFAHWMAIFLPCHQP